MPTYTPPPGTSIPLGLTGDYTPPPGAQTQINVGDAVATPPSPNRDIPFLGPAAAAKPNDVLIALGTALSRPGAILEIDTIGDGQGFDSVVFTSISLPLVSFATGESVGHANRQLKDKRLYGNLIGLRNPFSLGLAFLTESLPSWPSGYTSAGVVTHFYSGAWGIPLKTSVEEALVLPAFVLTDVFGGGEVAVPVYSATPGVIGGASGEALGLILGVTFEGVGFTTATGEGLSPAITIDRRLAVALSHGQSVAVDLKIESTVTSVGTGESVSMSLDVYDLMPIRQYVGESLESTLSTRPVLQISMGTGESQTTAAEFHPTSYFTMAWGAGESLSPVQIEGHAASYFTMAWATGESHAAITLTTRSSLNTEGQAGESFVLSTLTMPPRQGIELPVGAGEAFGLELSTAANLGNVWLGEGVGLRVEEVVELPPYRFGASESLTASLYVITSLPVTFHVGETAKPDLDVRLPAFMRADFLVGEDISYMSMEVQYRATLHCAMHDGTFITVTEQTATTTYDLADPILYVDTLDWLTDMNAFEFVEMGPSFQYNKGAGILVTVDLQCRPAFTIGFATGESWALEANARYLAVDLTAPTAAIYPSEFFYVEPKINLCYPNVFPDADAMEVELDFTDDSCYADYMFAGQTMALSLSARHQMTVGGVTVGESFAFDLDLTQPWKVNFAVGTRMDFYLFTDVKLQSTLRTGESLKATFEETSINFVTGESVVATLHTTFDVEFLERGCLDNEYRYLKPDGFEDVDKFNPVSVELEPFAHDIKARCF